MKSKTFEIGTVVKVYEDPITCKKLEGEATLEFCWNTHGETEQWHVRFKDEEGYFSRAINKEIH